MLHHNNVKKIREQKNLTQNQVIEKINMGLKAYQNLENGKTKLDTERMELLANVFSVPMLDLVKNDNNISIDKIENNIGGISNNEVNITHNNQSDEMKRIYEIALKSKDDLILEQKGEIEYLKNEVEQLKKQLN